MYGIYAFPLGVFVNGKCYHVVVSWNGVPQIIHFRLGFPFVNHPFGAPPWPWKPPWLAYDWIRHGRVPPKLWRLNGSRAVEVHEPHGLCQRHGGDSGPGPLPGAPRFECLGKIIIYWSRCGFIYMYIYIYYIICYIYILYIYIILYILYYIYSNIYIYICIYIYMCAYVYVHTYMCIHICAYIYVHTYTYTPIILYKEVESYIFDSIYVCCKGRQWLYRWDPRHVCSQLGRRDSCCTKSFGGFHKWGYP